MLPTHVLLGELEGAEDCRSIGLGNGDGVAEVIVVSTSGFVYGIGNGGVGAASGFAAATASAEPQPPEAGSRPASPQAAQDLGLQLPAIDTAANLAPRLTRPRVPTSEATPLESSDDLLLALSVAAVESTPRWAADAADPGQPLAYRPADPSIWDDVEDWLADYHVQ